MRLRDELIQDLYWWAADNYPLVEDSASGRRGGMSLEDVADLALSHSVALSADDIVQFLSEEGIALPLFQQPLDTFQRRYPEGGATLLRALQDSVRAYLRPFAETEMDHLFDAVLGGYFDALEPR